MAEISVTLKGGPGYDAPWVVFKGEVNDVGQDLESFRKLGLFAAVQAAAIEFQAQKEDGKAVQAVRQVNPGAEVVSQELPDAMKPKCAHGQMVFKQGHSTKQKRDYEGYFCPKDDKTHKPEQFRWTS